MNKLQEIIHYIINNYPVSKKSDLSNARLTKLVFLSDWKNVIKYNRQISDIKWIFNHYGPYVNDIKENATNNNFIYDIHNGCLYFTDVQDKKYNYKHLTDKDKEVCNTIIHLTEDKTFSDFIRYVYSTYPIKISEKLSTLNLVEINKKRKKYLNDN